jgi:hypothetical protein
LTPHVARYRKSSLFNEIINRIRPLRIQPTGFDKEIRMQKYHAYMVIFLAYILGGSSLVMFGTFCYVGSLHLVKLGLSESGTVLLDVCLSLAFFLQHSGMVRKSFRRYLARFIPKAYNSAIYTILSGIVLFIVIIFWQGTSGTVATAEGALRLLLRVIFAASYSRFLLGNTGTGVF